MEEIICRNKKYYVKRISRSRGCRFTAQYHYSGVGFNKSMVNLGIFRNEDELMVGVCQLGVSFQDAIKLERYTSPAVKKEEYLELNRFCMADSEGHNSESQALSLMLKWIKRNMPEIRLLVSYSGRVEGNYGYIYQSTNFEYLGYFISPGFWELDGEIRHMTTLWARYKRYKNPNNLGFTEAICEMHERVVKTETKQFIYIMRLDKSLTPANEPLPYPKPSNEYPIKTREKIYKELNPLSHYKKSEVKEIIYFYDDEIEEIKKRNGRPVAVYSLDGHLVKTFDSSGEIVMPNMKLPAIRCAISTGNAYKEHYFRFFDEEPLDEIEVPIVAIVQEIPFKFMAELGRYLGVSRQGIHNAKKRNQKTIKGIPIEWVE